LLAPAAGASEPLPPAISDTETVADSRPNDGRGARLLRSIDSEVTFEVAVPWEQLRTDAADAAGYVRVSIPGWSSTARAGAPMLPMMAQAIAVPFGAELSVQVEAGPAHTIALPATVLPVATQRVEWDPQADDDGAPTLPKPSLVLEEDPAVYAGDATYPGALAEVANDGVVRQQRVAGVVAYPVQYRPATKELTVYEWLRVTVTFEGAQAAGGKATSIDSPAYEKMLRGELLNYETARSWRQALTPSPSSVLGEGEEAEPDISAASAPWAPPSPGWRVKVREEGLYKLTYAELQAAGLPVGTLDPRTFRLYNLGSEVAIQVTGESDGKFGSGDSIIFYGQAVASKYTWDNVYWLTYGGANGLRMASRSGAPGTAATPASYRARRHLESNPLYLSNAPGDDNLERFMWDYVYPPSRPSWTHTFSLAAPYTQGETARLTVAMLGYLQSSINPDHHAQVTLNGTLVGDVRWDGIAWQVATFDVAPNLLVAGNNTLKVTAPNDTGVGYDVIYIDWAELEYDAAFAASANVLPFTAVSGTWKYDVTGFATDQLAVYDVTSPAAVAWIEGVVASPSGTGYAASFQDAVIAPTRYWAMASTAYRTVQAIEADTASAWQSTANHAEYVVITHPAFAAQAETLRAFRALQGLDAVLVNVQDVYDEFGYGIVGAAPIRDFLAFAYGRWQTKPSYVVLVGDGHYDPKNYLGYGRASYIPPFLAVVDPWIGETAGDNRYVTLAGADTMPDMMLGRLTVNSSAEAGVVVGKITTYEGQEPADWQQQVLAVADNADTAGNFAASSDALLSGYLPQPYQATKVYYGATHTTVDGARTAMQAGINAGKLIVSYFGHAGIDLWAEEGLLKLADVPLLQNGAKLPVVLSMTCYDGSYHYPSTAFALAEALTRADGKGAVASWSPTGLGITAGHDYLARGFFQAVFQNGPATLGEATNAGKLALWTAGGSPDLLDTYLLFGDPATTVPVVEPPPSADLQLAKVVSSTGEAKPGAVIEYTLTFKNNGPNTATGVILTDLMPTQLVNPQVVEASAGVTLRPNTAFTWDIQDLVSGASGYVKIRGTVDPALVPPATIVNSATLTSAVSDPAPANNSASVSTVVPASVLLPVLHVGAITVSYKLLKGYYTLTSTVTVLDAANKPVVGATVSAEWTLPSGTLVKHTATTNSKGKATFSYKDTLGGTYKLCVTNLAKAGWAYDASKNVENCDSVTTTTARTK